MEKVVGRVPILKIGDVPSAIANCAQRRLQHAAVRGRVTRRRTAETVYPYTYYYNAQGQLSGKAFPNYYTQRYDYTNGRLTSIGSTTLMWGQFLGGSTLWQLTAENAFGQPLQYAWGNGQQAALAYDAYQLLQAKSAGGQLPAQSYSFTPSTGNLASRNLGAATESFSYDHLHRLTQWAAGSYADYAPNGNITDKGDVGSYQYHSQRPHAVAGVTDIWDWGSLRPTAKQRIAYDSKNRPTCIAQGADSLVFGYDHTGQRLYTKHYNKGALYKTTHYVGEYEKDIYADRAVSRCFVHAPTGLLAVREEAYTVARGEGSGKTTMLYTHTDHLGSIVGLSDANGSKLAEYSYDPWGRLRDPQTLELYAHGKAPKLRLGRGFTGHEHLPEFGLINMNARLYDPVLGRFLSPDPYVVDGENSQDYNRYTYARNNPLKYTDPNGEWIHLIIGAAIGGTINWALNGAEFSWEGLGYFGIGAVAGALGAGVGAGVNVAMAGGSFGAGFVGTAAGVSSTGFIAGAATGAAAGFSGGFITNSGNAWIGGANFGESLWSGVKGGGIGALAGGVLGGTIGGIDALTNGTNFWTGKASFDLSNAYGASGNPIGEQTITGKYVGKFEGANMYEADISGGVTLPGRGIIVYEGAFSRGTDMPLIQHEFGHILQAKEVGLKAFYNVIAPESLASATLDQVTNGVWNHNSFWTETWANYLSNGYFGAKSLLLNNSTWPAQNISWFNLLRLRTAAVSPFFLP